MMTSLIIYAINILKIHGMVINGMDIHMLENFIFDQYKFYFTVYNVFYRIYGVNRNMPLEMAIKRVYEPSRLMERPLSMDYWP